MWTQSHSLVDQGTFAISEISNSLFWTEFVTTSRGCWGRNHSTPLSKLNLKTVCSPGKGEENTSQFCNITQNKTFFCCLTSTDYRSVMNVIDSLTFVSVIRGLELTMGSRTQDSSAHVILQAWVPEPLVQNRLLLPSLCCYQIRL